MNEINKNLASSKQLHDKKYNDFIQLLENLKYDSKVKDINFPIEHIIII